MKCNELSTCLKQFVYRASAINEIEKRPFSFGDFPHISKGNFRQIIRRLGSNRVETVTRGRPAFYKIRGIELPLDSHRVTDRPMGDIKNLVTILEQLRDQPAKVHDIKIKFSNSSLHPILKSKGEIINQSNNSIKIEIPYTDNNIVVKALVYPETTQIDIGCTFKPLIYDHEGVIILTQILSYCLFYLEGKSSFQAHISDVTKWIVTHWHFNKDGSEHLSGQSFHYSWSDTITGFVRYYSKQMPDGTTIARIEQIQTPQMTISEIALMVMEK